MTASNPLCPCHKSGAWRTYQEATTVLGRIMQQPPKERMYQPTRVTQCPHGIYHLTSKPAKVWAKGKKKHRIRRRK